MICPDDGREPEALAHAMVIERFASIDAARMRELDALLSIGQRCGYCDARLSEQSFQRHPGVCSNHTCRRRARREALAAQVRS